MRRTDLVRYAGLAGSLSLAVAAFLGGAHRPWRPTMTLSTIFAGRDGVLLPVAWLCGTVLLIGAWWAGRRLVPSARWAYFTAALWIVPLLPFLPLGSYDAYSYACQGWVQATGLDPYAGGVDLLGCPWSDAVAPTWRASPAPYGPVFLLLAAAAAQVGGSLAGTLAALRVISLFGLALVALWLPALARRAGVPLPRAVWLVLACPLVPIHLVSGAHNDAVMIGFLVAGLGLAVSRQPWLAGVVLGLAVGIKVTAVVVLPFAVLLLPRRARAGLVIAAIGALGFISMLSGRGLGWITGLAGSGVSVQWTAPATAVGITIDLVGPDAVPVTRVIGIVLLAGVLAWLFWRAAWRGGDPLLHAGYALAATVVLAPVFHPWYAVWPLAVLAATLRNETRWLTVPCAGASALCLPDGYNLALAVKSQGAVLMTALICYLGIKALKAVYEGKNQHRGVVEPDRGVHRVPGGDT